MSQFNPYQSPQFGGVDPVWFQPRRPLASRWARLGASLLNGLATVVAVAPGYVIILSADRSQEAAMVGLGIVAIGVLAIMIIQVYLLSTQGQTIGKKAVGVRIVSYDTEETAGFVKAFLLRSLVNGLIRAIPCFGPIYSLVDILFIFGDECRCIHDLIAGTKVVEA